VIFLDYFQLSGYVECNRSKVGNIGNQTPKSIVGAQAKQILSEHMKNPQKSLQSPGECIVQQNIPMKKSARITHSQRFQYELLLRLKLRDECAP